MDTFWASNKVIVFYETRSICFLVEFDRIWSHIWLFFLWDLQECEGVIENILNSCAIICLKNYLLKLYLLKLQNHSIKNLFFKNCPFSCNTHILRHSILFDHSLQLIVRQRQYLVCLVRRPNSNGDDGADHESHQI